MNRTESLRCGVCAVLLAVTGCSKSEAPAAAVTPAPVAPAVPAAPVAKVPVARAPVVEDATFKLSLSGEPAYQAGQPAALKLLLEARGGYHVNQEYPIRIDLKAPAGFTLTKASLARADAASFGEHDARFDVGFSAAAGTYELVADVDFAVCTAETCVPDQRSLALSIVVK